MDLSRILDFLGTPVGRMVLMAAIGVGVLLVCMGLFRLLLRPSAAAVRMTPKVRAPSILSPGAGWNEDGPTSALAKAIIPENEDERRQVAYALIKAGFRSRNAVTGYYLLRVILGVGLPVVFLLLLQLSDLPQMPAVIQRYFSGMSTLSIVQHIAILCGIGFFGPTYWLRARINRRKRAIEMAFPNLMDLLQVGVEAGMGFDQALLKVSTEIQTAAPELAEEMLTVLSEIQAGRNRDSALLKMARRVGIEEMSSFVNVVLQSGRFGTPMSDALTTYAEEMRVVRELKAQEMANKLPVKMSAVLASVMLPALIALILMPIILRYINNLQ
ncbi:type II secretion system F family protein [Rhodobacterales bacterium HKCCE3408]|nr:type II secretion system F family protein [Rhodobacterales bacterium HKCCE3408]